MNKFDLEKKKLEYQERKNIKISVIEEESNKIKKIYNNKNISKEKIKNNHHNIYSNLNDNLNYYNEENKYGCVGLYNLGNTCYMNSSLQILKNIYPLTKYILLENKIKEGIIIKEYTNLLYNLISKNNSSTEASEFKEALSIYNNYFSGYEQKDCIKCITSVLSALNMDLKRKEINKYEIINKNDEEEIKFNDSYNKIIKRKNSIIFDLFFGFLKLLYKCRNCEYNKVVFQCFNYLDLSVFDIDNNTKINNLEDCIKYYEREIKSEFKCEKCGGEIIMKNIIYKLPKILIICFNRVYNNEHLNHLVEYPEYFNPNNYFSEKPKTLFNTKEENLYSLNGLIIHFGSANSGHKTSLCKNFFNDNWYYFNDNSKYYIKNQKEILNLKHAFLLVYEINQNKLDNIEDIKKVCDKNYNNNFSYMFQNNIKIIKKNKNYNSKNKKIYKNEYYKTNNYNYKVNEYDFEK